MKMNSAFIIGMLTFLLAISGIVYKFGRQGQLLATSAANIKTFHNEMNSRLDILKNTMDLNEKYLNTVDKIAVTNKDNLSSLQTWTSSNIVNIDSNIKSQGGRLNRANVRAYHDREVFNNRLCRQK